MPESTLELEPVPPPVLVPEVVLLVSVTVDPPVEEPVLELELPPPPLLVPEVVPLVSPVVEPPVPELAVELESLPPPVLELPADAVVSVEVELPVPDVEPEVGLVLPPLLVLPGRSLVPLLRESSSPPPHAARETANTTPKILSRVNSITPFLLEKNQNTKAIAQLPSTISIR
ncbi:MAG TPA: hypothetical protein VFP68_11390 [Burkholderiaceae bacterium]|nr:hypothetical protein [Burkholderiaceae bacterium]